MTDKILRLRRGTTVAHSCYVGPNGEVTIDLDKKVVVVHDGVTPGGFPLASEASLDVITGITTPSTFGSNRQVLATNGVDELYWTVRTETTVSATAPVSPFAGDVWIDSENGIKFTYYDGQWVQF